MRVRLPRCAALLAGVLSALALAACGGDDDDTTAETSGDDSSSVELGSLIEDDPCGVLSRDEVEALVGGPVGQGIGSAGDAETQMTGKCSWMRKGGDLDAFADVTGLSLSLGDADTYSFITSIDQPDTEELDLGDESSYTPGDMGGGFAALLAGDGSITVEVGGGEPDGEARDIAIETLETALANLQ